MRDVTKRKKGGNIYFPSAVRNSVIFQHYYNQLKEIAIGMFKWENMPPYVDQRFLEMTLFDKGFCVFFRDEIADAYVALTTEIGGELDIYRIPKRRRAYAPNGYNRSLTSNDSVLIFDNLLHINDVMKCEMFAYQLFRIQTAIDVNVSGQKYPIIIQCSEKQRLSMEQLVMNFDGGDPFLYVTESMDLNGIQVFPTKVPFVANDLYILKRKVWNEAMECFGIESTTREKRERLVGEEMSSSLGSTLAQRHTRLRARQEACEQINAMFGLDISVDYALDFAELLPNSVDALDHMLGGNGVE